ncbi:unnamed protein product [Victoria cruziana]
MVCVEENLDLARPKGRSHHYRSLVRLLNLPCPLHEHICKQIEARIWPKKLQYLGTEEDQWHDFALCRR